MEDCIAKKSFEEFKADTNICDIIVADIRKRYAGKEKMEQLVRHVVKHYLEEYLKDAYDRFSKSETGSKYRKAALNKMHLVCNKCLNQEHVDENRPNKLTTVSKLQGLRPNDTGNSMSHQGGEEQMEPVSYSKEELQRLISKPGPSSIKQKFIKMLEVLEMKDAASKDKENQPTSKDLNCNISTESIAGHQKEIACGKIIESNKSVESRTEEPELQARSNKPVDPQKVNAKTLELKSMKKRSRRSGAVDEEAPIDVDFEPSTQKTKINDRQRKQGTKQTKINDFLKSPSVSGAVNKTIQAENRGKINQSHSQSDSEPYTVPSPWQSIQRRRVYRGKTWPVAVISSKRGPSPTTLVESREETVPTPTVNLQAPSRSDNQLHSESEDDNYELPNNWNLFQVRKMRRVAPPRDTQPKPSPVSHSIDNHSRQTAVITTNNQSLPAKHTSSASTESLNTVLLLTEQNVETVSSTTTFPQVKMPVEPHLSTKQLRPNALPSIQPNVETVSSGTTSPQVNLPAEPRTSTKQLQRNAEKQKELIHPHVEIGLSMLSPCQFRQYSNIEELVLDGLEIKKYTNLDDKCLKRLSAAGLQFDAHFVFREVPKVLAKKARINYDLLDVEAMKELEIEVKEENDEPSAKRRRCTVEWKEGENKDTEVVVAEQEPAREQNENEQPEEIEEEEEVTNADNKQVPKVLNASINQSPDLFSFSGETKSTQASGKTTQTTPSDISAAVIEENNKPSEAIENMEIPSLAVEAIDKDESQFVPALETTFVNIERIEFSQGTVHRDLQSQSKDPLAASQSYLTPQFTSTQKESVSTQAIEKSNSESDCEIIIETTTGHMGCKSPEVDDELEQLRRDIAAGLSPPTTPVRRSLGSILGRNMNSSIVNIKSEREVYSEYDDSVEYIGRAATELIEILDSERSVSGLIDEFCNINVSPKKAENLIAAAPIGSRQNVTIRKPADRCHVEIIRVEVLSSVPQHLETSTSLPIECASFESEEEHSTPTRTSTTMDLLNKDSTFFNSSKLLAIEAPATRPVDTIPIVVLIKCSISFPRFCSLTNVKLVLSFGRIQKLIYNSPQPFGQQQSNSKKPLKLLIKTGAPPPNRLIICGYTSRLKLFLAHGEFEEALSILRSWENSNLDFLR